MKTTAAFGILMMILPALAQADTYHRFWQGSRLPDLSAADFQKDLCSVFIPATVETGAGKGMIGYEPVLTQGIAGLPDGFPDEIALVSYRDVDSYNALYSTALGKAYQALHWKYFDKSRSHSMVPGPFSGSVAIGRSYDLHPSYDGWMNAQTHLRVSLRQAGETDSRFLARIKDELDRDLTEDSMAGVRDRVLLTAQDYWLEYVSFDHEAPVGGDADFVFPLQAQSASDARIASGQGINLQF